MPMWGKTDVENDKPKYLTNDDKLVTYGVNETEARVTANRANGIKTPGWVKYTTYTDCNGNVRHKAEVLVALSNATFAVMGDATDDTVIPDA